MNLEEDDIFMFCVVGFVVVIAAFLLTACAAPTASPQTPSETMCVTGPRNSMGYYATACGPPDRALILESMVIR